MKPTWSVLPKASGEFFKGLQDIPSLTAQLLWNRSVRDAKSARDFLHPDPARDFHDPFLFTHMPKAVERIRHAFERKEKVVIWGDYDCDGVCGTSILFTVFRDLGHEGLLNVHIPDRNKEGYGLTMEHLEELFEEGAKLIITVDCGITDNREIAWAQSRGIDVIVADHHSVPPELPPAYAILNPKDARSGYPFPGLAGTGVAFKLASALLGDGKRPELSAQVRDLLDLVALATLADSMPLVGENRAMVREGMLSLAHTSRPGLRALLEFCGLAKDFTVRDVHFSLIPRLNAMGRMEHASISFRLLTTCDENEIPSLIRHLDERNRERQLVTDVIVEDVLDRLSKRTEKTAAIFECSSGWMAGVLGLAAQRVMNQVKRPVILAITDEKNGRVMGNARALGAFDLVKVMRSNAELFSEAGGHPHAAGFSTTPDKLDAIREAFLREAEEVMSRSENAGEHEMFAADGELGVPDVSEKTYEEIQRISPFGEENIEPQFLLRGLAVQYARAVGNGEQHLKLRLGAPKEPGGKTLEAIGFGLGGYASKLRAGSAIDVIAKLSRNVWNGRKTVELQLADLDIIK